MGNCASQPTATVSDEDFVNEKSTAATHDYIASKMSAEGLTDTTSMSSCEKKEDFLRDPLDGKGNDGLLDLSFDDNPFMAEVEKELQDDKEDLKSAIEPPIHLVLAAADKAEEKKPDIVLPEAGEASKADSTSQARDGDFKSSEASQKESELVCENTTKQESEDMAKEAAFDKAADDHTNEDATSDSAIPTAQETVESEKNEKIEASQDDKKDDEEEPPKTEKEDPEETTNTNTEQKTEDKETDAKKSLKDLEKEEIAPSETAKENDEAKDTVPEEVATKEEESVEAATEVPSDMDNDKELSKECEKSRDESKTSNEPDQSNDEKDDAELNSMDQKDDDKEPESEGQKNDKDNELDGNDQKNDKEMKMDESNKPNDENDENAINDATLQEVEMKEKSIATPKPEHALEEKPEDTSEKTAAKALNDSNDDKAISKQATESSDSESEASTDDSDSAESSSDEDSEEERATENTEKPYASAVTGPKEPSAIEKEAMVYKVATGKKAIEARGPGARRAKEDSSSGSDSSSSSDSSDSDDEPQIYLFTSFTSGDRRVMGDTHRLHTMLKANDIDFTVVDLATNERAKRLWRLRGKDRRLPAVVREDEIVGGYNEMEEANESGFLREVVLEDEIMS
ncbi:hypothetical protein TRVA0_016S00914 [Trichomonascus vanleenenianus]|uniref:uncharacterized protein n=1 Tax=Trichomonascus vanleenenianus TaxID=2268995 RepID=UPI003ECAB982